MSDHGKEELCLAYAAGPGDVVSTFSHWQRGEDDPHQLAITYSGQFFDVCRNLGARGVAISSCPRADHIFSGRFYVENLPKGKERKGAWFHLEQIRYLRKVIKIAESRGADLLIMSDATGHFFPFKWFAPSNMSFVPSIHCTLWSKFSAPSRVQSLINRLNRSVFRRQATAILCLSKDIQRQIQEIAGSEHRPIMPFLPIYRRGIFDKLAEPSQNSPFNLLFAGRMEEEKGIFDLLQMAVDFKKAGRSDIHIHLCGDGSSEEILRLKASEKEVEDIFFIHGYCRQKEMLNQISQSHALIVPTTTAFGEGFNKVVIEGILSGRPVVTSEACPAIEMLREAVVEVPPDDQAAYRMAVERLASDRILYDNKQQASLALRDQFYSLGKSWGQALLNAVERRSDDS